ncbi:MAG: NlpC/P60 family protein [Planctomycetota bacterium]
MTMDVLSTLDRYREIPWVDGGRDVDRDHGLDCWGLARRVVLDLTGVELPEDNSEAFARMGELARVVEADELREGDLVLMHRDLHVGVCLGDRIVHSSKTAGVQCITVEALRRLKLATRVLRPRRKP